MSTIEFYRAQAADALRQSEEANLPAVRDRCMRSAAAWTAMIERLEAVEVQKSVNDARRAAAAA